MMKHVITLISAGLAVGLLFFPPSLVPHAGGGTIYFWLGGQHAYYALEPNPSHFVIMRIKVYRRQEE